ncbi:MAG: FAD-dependent oxidoreductase [Prosthecobacter sp.]|nr:FAD-dependent oxidoreductase [Prosthecobacter sp.]
MIILGGGPAGLATGHFARKAGLEFQLLEASSRFGGNAVTFVEDGFRFDSGAHRFHDRDRAMTAEIKSLLGDELLECAIPSQIYHHGKFVDFPLSPLNLLRALGVRSSLRAAGDLLSARIGNSGSLESFEHQAVRTYGRDIADRFLLGYSEKLWGLPGSQLCPSISGKRLQGLDLRTFWLETFRGQNAKSAHLDGHFYYPRLGFGTIADKLAASCGQERLRAGARVTGFQHDGRRIHAVEVNGEETMPVSRVISTLPLSLTARLLGRALPASIESDIARLKFRQVVLVALYLNKPSVTRVGSVYFPDPGYPMTRVYEPRNRSAAMAPEGRTMLAVEIPCWSTDEIWKQDDDQLIRLVADKLQGCGWYREDELAGGCVKRIPNAYPVLEAGIQDVVKRILDATSRFENLTILGRNGEFRYTHTHDMLRLGHDAVEALMQEQNRP